MAIIKKSDVNLILKNQSVPEALHDELQDVYDRYQELYDGKSEKWQESAKGEALQAWLSTLEDVLSGLDTAMQLPDLINGDGDYDPLFS